MSPSAGWSTFGSACLMGGFGIWYGLIVSVNWRYRDSYIYGPFLTGGYMVLAACLASLLVPPLNHLKRHLDALLYGFPVPRGTSVPPFLFIAECTQVLLLEATAALLGLALVVANWPGSVPQGYYVYSQGLIHLVYTWSHTDFFVKRTGFKYVPGCLEGAICLAVALVTSLIHLLVIVVGPTFVRKRQSILALISTGVCVAGAVLVSNCKSISSIGTYPFVLIVAACCTSASCLFLEFILSAIRKGLPILSNTSQSQQPPQVLTVSQQYSSYPMGSSFESLPFPPSTASGSPVTKPPPPYTPSTYDYTASSSQYGPSPSSGYSSQYTGQYPTRPLTMTYTVEVWPIQSATSTPDPPLPHTPIHEDPSPAWTQQQSPPPKSSGTVTGQIIRMR
mmetsp:Transcript_4144/g.6369  ORF Transcript_4144/g.6369 Transcript_4144/m.6369 type:complete len:392 (-) Transcript_4144:400-1575(-)